MSGSDQGDVPHHSGSGKARHRNRKGVAAQLGTQKQTCTQKEESGKAIAVGTEVNLEKRIYGGTQCPQGDRGYHVKLRADNGNKNILCGGSLISDRWILTAAHCGDPEGTMHAILGVHPGPEQEVEIKKMVPYTDGTKNIHDIMLLQLPSATEIPPVQLPDCEKDRKRFSSSNKILNWLSSMFKSNKFQVAGHGLFQMDKNGQALGDPSTFLRCAKMNAADCTKVRDDLNKRFPHVPYKNWLCGKGKGVDTCSGDSGGGVVYKNTIYAVVTDGLKRLCVQPSVFLKVCPYMDWIKETMANNP